MDRLQAMRIYTRVARMGSFVRAAADLDLSRATVSESVAALERHLGVQLLRRTTRRVSLTQEGADYLERCQRILNEVEAAEQSVRGTRDRPQGMLRVDVPTAFGRHLLVPALPEFMKRYPEIELDLRLNDRTVDLVADRVDLAVRMGSVRPQNYVGRRIATTRRVICASPGYLAAVGRPTRPEDLAGHRLLALSAGSTGRRIDWSFRGRRAPALHYAATFNLAESQVSAALNGAGLAQTIDLLVLEEVARGRLETVLDEFVAEGPPISVVFAAAARREVKVKLFADFAEGLMQRWRAGLAARAARTS